MALPTEIASSDEIALTNPFGGRLKRLSKALAARDRADYISDVRAVLCSSDTLRPTLQPHYYTRIPIVCILCSAVSALLYL
jgi:hypothetical protein